MTKYVTLSQLETGVQVELIAPEDAETQPDAADEATEAATDEETDEAAQTE